MHQAVGHQFVGVDAMKWQNSRKTHDVSLAVLNGSVNIPASEVIANVATNTRNIFRPPSSVVDPIPDRRLRKTSARREHPVQSRHWWGYGETIASATSCANDQARPRAESGSRGVQRRHRRDDRRAPA